jgi:hypothetical protein
MYVLEYIKDSAKTWKEIERESAWEYRRDGTFLDY